MPRFGWKKFLMNSMAQSWSLFCDSSIANEHSGELSAINKRIKTGIRKENKDDTFKKSSEKIHFLSLLCQPINY